MDAIFLSASVPEADRPGFDTADPLLIHAAIRSFLTLTLGRRHIVFGGHPSITPMVLAACENFGLEYLDCVSIYQSEYFIEEFPKYNDQFIDLKLVQAGTDKAHSLKKLRQAIFTQNEFVGGVFIGGMEGVKEEFDYLRHLQPKAVRVPIYSAGGVAAKLAVLDNSEPDPEDLANDFTTFFATKLNIDTSEQRLELGRRRGPRP